MRLTARNVERDGGVLPNPDRRVWWPLFARITWLGVAGCAGWMVIAGLPLVITQRQAICGGPGCGDWQLTAASARALETLGGSLVLYAASTAAIELTFMIVLYALAAVLIWRKPTNLMALFAAFTFVALGAASSDAPLALATTYPAWLGPGRVVGFLQGAALLPFFSLFPNGRFVPRWTRWVALGWVVWNLATALLPDRVTSPTIWYYVSSVSLPAAFCLIVGSQVYRYRRVSNRVERQQTRWVLYGIALQTGVLVSLIVATAVVPVLNQPHTLWYPAASLIWLCAKLLGPLAIGVAILRYHLFDIDLVINRTLTYGALTAGVLALYGLVVGVLGTLVHANSADNLAISLVATGMAAVAFQPLRARLQRGVNRLMYGERDDPYAVIARLGARLEATIEPVDILPTVVHTVAQALKLPYAGITVMQDGDVVSAASWGQPTDPLLRLPLHHGDETIGELALAPRAPGELFSAADCSLLSDLARQAGAAAHAVLLTAALERSRLRVVTAREEARRQLGNDLHDHLGHQLTSLLWRIDTASNLLERDPDGAQERFTELARETKAAISEVRSLAHQLHPPELELLGLVEALRERIRSSFGSEPEGLRVTVDASEPLPALPAAVEIAAYTIIQEALTNATRHARARSCLVRVALVVDEARSSLRWNVLDAPVLEIEIRDDGCGLLPRKPVGKGLGLASMRQRAAELGGTLAVESVLTGGTRVLARLPCPPT